MVGPLHIGHVISSFIVIDVGLNKLGGGWWLTVVDSSGWWVVGICAGIGCVDLQQMVMVVQSVDAVCMQVVEAVCGW